MPHHDEVLRPGGGLQCCTSAIVRLITRKNNQMTSRVIQAKVQQHPV